VNENIARYRDRIFGYWGQFSGKQKMMIGITFIALIAIIVILINIFSKTSYELAFRDLDTTDAAGIVQYLESNSIAYKLGPDGTSISVPSAVASKVKVDVGSQGMVQNGSLGFAEFSNGASQFGMTDNEFNVKFRNAVNGEVQQLLNSMQGVQKSNVLVNLPQESVFAPTPGEEEKASAAITMTFKPGFRPTQEQIDGYYNLVKSAVPKLAVDDITISSPQGELYASSKSGGAAGAAASALDNNFLMQRKYESELKRNIQQYLGTMLGDKMVISVASSMNFDQKKSIQDLVQPLPDNNNNGIIISETDVSKTATGSDSAAGGVAGTGETDVPGYQATSGEGSSASEETSATRNYEISRVKNEILSAPYVVKDLTISLGVDQNALTEQNRTAVMSYLTEVVRGQLADSGQNLTDDVAIGKKVTIISQAFAPQTNTSASGVSVGWVIGIGAVAVALAGVAVFLIVRRRKQAAEIAAAEQEIIQSAKIELPTIDLDGVTNESQVRKQLEQLAKRKPDDFVNLLRTWLVDE
jgi:flagellar M-ring protein FliF